MAAELVVDSSLGYIGMLIPCRPLTAPFLGKQAIGTPPTDLQSRSFMIFLSVHAAIDFPCNIR